MLFEVCDKVNVHTKHDKTNKKTLTSFSLKMASIPRLFLALRKFYLNKTERLLQIL